MRTYTVRGKVYQNAIVYLALLLFTLLIASGCGSSQDMATETERPVPERPVPERTAFLVGQVLFPNGEPAERATVQTEPFTTTVQADTQGVFYIYEEIASGDYQFVARHARYPDERGQTAITIGEEAVSDSVYIVMGRAMTYQPIDVDTLGTSGGLDKNRTDN